MIEIAGLKKEDVGLWVIYNSGHHQETGKIKSWNDKWIFVVFKCGGDWNRFQNYTGCATNPHDLKFAT